MHYPYNLSVRDSLDFAAREYDRGCADVGALMIVVALMYLIAWKGEA